MYLYYFCSVFRYQSKYLFIREYIQIMKSRLSKLAALSLALFIVVSVLSSCNRGYGCPYELKAITSAVCK
jgi:hypothetical protein